MQEDGVTALIPLHAADGSARAFAIVDVADAVIISQRRWSLNPVDGYAQRTQKVGAKRQQIKMHRAILGLTGGDDLEVDHINRNRLDNRRCNLRAIPKAGNRQNLPKHRDGSSRYRGVSWDKARQKWHARCGTVHLGRFDTEEAAAKAAQDARARLLPYAID